tara:strand:- start:520 stop:795 length:276 start_codon:yes stop_codon:yes gene_type:complete
MAAVADNLARFDALPPKPAVFQSVPLFSQLRAANAQFSPIAQTPPILMQMQSLTTQLTVCAHASSSTTHSSPCAAALALSRASRPVPTRRR